MVEEYPTASFTIKEVNENSIVGDLTIRDITQEETIEDVSYSINEETGTMTASGKLVFNRQDYNVDFSMEKGMNVTDKAVADEIDLNIELVAKSEKVQ